MLEIERPRKLSFTWNSQPINGETVITIDLEPDGDSTRLKLTHSGWTAAQEEMQKAHDGGWDERFVKLLPSNVAGSTEKQSA